MKRYKLTTRTGRHIEIGANNLEELWNKIKDLDYKECFAITGKPGREIDRTILLPKRK